MCEKKIGLQRKPGASFGQLDSAATHADDFMASSDETSMARKKAGTWHTNSSNVAKKEERGARRTIAVTHSRSS
jgi:hypothetical protein